MQDAPQDRTMDDGRIIAVAALICSALQVASCLAQTPQKPDATPSGGIRCLIQTERPQWNRNTETILSGTIENLTDGPLQLEVEPAVYLTSRTSSELGNRFWAPVDLLHDTPLGTNKRPISGHGTVIGIESRSILLEFKTKGDAIHFRIDAQHLLWASDISSVWPSSAFFSTVKSGDYDVQLVLETDNGRVESPNVNISIDVKIDPFQDVARTMFPNAPEKTQNVSCFRSLKRGMSIDAVVQKCGRPDEEVGSGIYIFVWDFMDGSATCHTLNAKRLPWWRPPM
jgi:hypothetical protein